MRDRPNELRCAIYTRKSSEEGLEQDARERRPLGRGNMRQMPTRRRARRATVASGHARARRWPEAPVLRVRRARYRHPTELVGARRAADVVKARGGGSRPVTGRAYSKLNKRTANQTKATEATIAGPICHSLF